MVLTSNFHAQRLPNEINFSSYGSKRTRRRLFPLKRVAFKFDIHEIPAIFDVDNRESIELETGMYRLENRNCIESDERGSCTAVI